MAPHSWFDRPERLAALEQAALRWQGTPFAPRSAVVGRGVCCHLLIAEIMREAGAVPADVARGLPRGSRKWSRFHGRSLMEEWLDGPGALWFFPLTTEFPPVAGDIVGARIGRCIHHLAVVVEGPRYVHCLEDQGVVIEATLPGPIARRVERIWRPLP